MDIRGRQKIFEVLDSQSDEIGVSGMIEPILKDGETSRYIDITYQSRIVPSTILNTLNTAGLLETAVSVPAKPTQNEPLLRYLGACYPARENERIVLSFEDINT